MDAELGEPSVLRERLAPHPLQLGGLTRDDAVEGLPAVHALGEHEVGGGDVKEAEDAAPLEKGAQVVE